MPEAFRKGVASYLKKHSYSNAAGEDFWSEVARVTGKPVDRIMRSFVDQMGAPVLSVRNSCSQNKSEIDLKVSRFLGTPGAPPAPQTWTLPVCLEDVRRPGPVRADRPAASRPSRSTRCGAAFANADSRGYYFTDYTADTVRRLCEEPRQPHGVGADQPARRRVVDGARRPPRHRPLSRPRGGHGQRRDAGRSPRRSRTGWRRSATTSPTPRSGPRYQAWIRARFGPVLTALGLPGPAGDSDDRQGRRGTLLHLVGVTGNDPDVQRKARSWRCSTSPIRLDSLDAGAERAAGGGDRRRCARSTSSISRS